MKGRYKNICAVVLAGGKCTRYKGENKAFLKIDDETFYDRTISLLRNIFEEIVVITNDPDDFPKDNIPKYQDIIKNIGPLGGIHTALSNAGEFDAIFIVAVDMPYLDEDTIRKITKNFLEQDIDILIPKIGDNIEPLSAIYSIKILARLNEYLKATNNFSIRSFLKVVNTTFFELDATQDNKKSFYNINSPLDYEEHMN
ncbi:MAG: molybdenum cofactor guanylyltransferase [Bacteroidales bacterium]|nr:molybdenum cofactor guanylyltransferase [Bacteroidales bacterium]